MKQKLISSMIQHISFSEWLSHSEERFFEYKGIPCLVTYDGAYSRFYVGIGKGHPFFDWANEAAFYTALFTQNHSLKIHDTDFFAEPLPEDIPSFEFLSRDVRWIGARCKSFWDGNSHLHPAIHDARFSAEFAEYACRRFAYYMDAVSGLNEEILSDTWVHILTNLLGTGERERYFKRFEYNSSPQHRVHGGAAPTNDAIQ